MKNLELPENIQKLFMLGNAYAKCRNEAVKYPYSYRRALKYSIKSEEFLYEAWRAVTTLFPETRENPNWYFSSSTGCLHLDN
jgi:hypothetical protein